MPQFHSTEKEKILQDLIENGRKLFIGQGLKKTSLEQMTQAAGVAKSTFYSFFESKEALYLTLLELEAIGMEKRVWSAVRRTSHIQEAVKAYLYAMVDELETNPLSKRLILHPEEMQMIARKVTPEFVGRKLERNVKPLMDFISENQENGLIINADPSVISGVIRAAMLLVVHKKDFGEDIFPQVKEIMFQAAASALTTLSGKRGE